MALAGQAAVEPPADQRLAEGKQLAMARNKGNCLACHAMADGDLGMVDLDCDRTTKGVAVDAGEGAADDNAQVFEAEFEVLASIQFADTIGLAVHGVFQ